MIKVENNPMFKIATKLLTSKGAEMYMKEHIIVVL